MEHQKATQALEGQGSVYEHGHIPRILAKFWDTKSNNQAEIENIQGKALPCTRGRGV